MTMLNIFLATLVVSVLVTAYLIYYSFKDAKKQSDEDQLFNDLYTDSLAKEIETQKKLEDKYYSNIEDAVEFEVVEIPEPVVAPKKAVKKKAAKKKSSKKTSKKRTANKIVKDEEV
jgi:hypothetical protein